MRREFWIILAIGAVILCLLALFLLGYIAMLWGMANKYSGGFYEGALLALLSGWVI